MGISKSVALSGSIAPVLLDNFTGTGQLSAHTPDTVPAGASWAIISGTWPDLASGEQGAPSSGVTHRTVINSGLNDFVLRWRIKYYHFSGGDDAAQGVMFRANSAGSDYYKAGVAKPSSGSTNTWAYWNVAGSIIIAPAQTNAQYRDTGLALTTGNYYTWELWVSGSWARMLDESGNILLAAQGAAKTTQNYLGLFTFATNANIKWDWLEVTPFSKKITIFNCLGDSIFAAGSGINYLSAAYRSGKTKVLNHGYTGYSINGASKMSTIVGLWKNETRDATILEFGTNDGSTTGVESAYLTNLRTLWAAHTGPYYAMGVLPRTAIGIRSDINTCISNACATARSEGIDVTYWNTDGWLDPAVDTSDGLHPNAAGSVKMKNEMLARL